MINFYGYHLLLTIDFAIHSQIINAISVLSTTLGIQYAPTPIRVQWKMSEKFGKEKHGEQY